MSMIQKICALLLLAVASVVFGANTTARADTGPRLSDAELLAALDPNFAALGRVITLRDRGDGSAAVSALAAFVRAKEEPFDFGQRAKRDPKADTSRAERILEHRFVVVGIPHTFSRDIDWGFNPTIALNISL